MTEPITQVGRSPLARRVIFWIVVSSIPAAAWAAWLFGAAFSSQQQMVRQAGQVAAQHTLDMLDRLVYERYGDARAFAGLPSLHALDPVQLPAVADHLVTSYAPYYELVLVVDRRGRILAVNRLDSRGQPIPSSPLIGRSVAAEPWFQRALQAGPSVAIEDVHPDPLLAQVYGEPRLAMSLSAPIHDDTGEVMGVLSTRVALAPLAESLVLMGRAYQPLGQSPVSLVLVTREGMELVRTATPGAPSEQPRQLARHVPAQPPLATVTSAGFSAYPGVGWQMKAYPPEGGIRPHELVMGSAGLLGWFAVAVVTIIWLLHRRVLVPLHAIAEAVGRMARREPVDLRAMRERDDELGMLARTVERTAHEVAEHRTQLEGVNAVSQSLQRAQILDMTVSRRDEFLTLVLESAVRLTQARYGALGVFDEAGERLAQFLTVGLDDATRAAIGEPPTGSGLLGFLAHEDGPVRLTDLTAHPRAVGFPPHHPPMRSFLGQSIKTHGQLYGRIYLTEKIGAEAFSETDATVLSILTAQAGVAIEDGEHVRQLRLAKERYRHLLESTEEGIYGLDLEGRCTFINQAGAALLGYHPDEVLGQPMHALIHHTRRDGTSYPVEACSIYRAFRTGRGCRLDDEVLWRKDGTWFPAEFCSSPVREGGRITGAVATFTDITARKRAEDGLRLKTEQVQAISETMLAFLQDGDWRAASSRLLRNALAQTASEYGFIGVVVGGPTLRILVHEGVTWDATTNRAFYEQAVQTYRERGYLEFTNFENLFGRVLTSGQVVLSNDPPHDPRAGGLPPGHPPLRCFLGVPILHGADVVGMIGVANRPGGYTETEQNGIEVLTQATGVLYDSYRRRQREATLETQLRQAQKMEAIGRLAGGIAHDFNNLLMVIRGYSELLGGELPSDDPRQANVEQIVQAGHRASLLTGQLLAFSRKQQVQPTRLDVNDVLTRMEPLLRRLIGEDIDFVVTPGQPLGMIYADPSHLEQVILNLALNARDAMAKGGRLTIETGTVEAGRERVCSHSTLTPGTYVWLRVTDTGMGMDAHTLEHLFEPFFTTKEQGKGTGLGLATVYGIMQGNHGVIDVASRPNEGTSFTLYFPRAQEAVSLSAEDAVEPAARRGSETVLLVEDEAGVRNWVRTVLTRQGYRVLEAQDGAEALQRCQHDPGPIHLLVTDMVMPGMSGPDLVARLEQQIPALRVLYMSGYTEHPVLRETGVEAGIAFLQKPFSQDALLRKIREVLEAPRG